MSIVVRFSPTNVTTEKYEETLRRLKEAGEFPPTAWSTTSSSVRTRTFV